MTKYRPHRGSLKDSMREVVEISNLDRLIEHLGASSTDRVEVSPYGDVDERFDYRIGWDTHLVTVNGLPVGFTDGPMDATEVKP